MGKIELHAKIKVRLPKWQKLKSEGDERHKPGPIIQTTYGRMLFNAILPKGMDFYNKGMKSGDLASVHLRLLPAPGPQGDDRPARRHDAARLPRSTRSGLSFATDDLITPATKVQHIGEAEKQVMQVQEALRARRDHREGALQPGARHLDARPRSDHRRNARGDADRRPRRHAAT